MDDDWRMIILRTDRREVSPPPPMLLMISNSRAEGEAVVLSSVARQCNSSGAERHSTREAKPTELMEDCNDGGGGE